MVAEFAQNHDHLPELHRRKNSQKIVNHLLHHLSRFEEDIEEKAHFFIGYPCSSGFDLDAFLGWWRHSLFSKIPCNEAGNPDEESSYVLNMRQYEREVLDYMAHLYHFPRGGAWGYLTTGGTQGNEQGLFIGREKLSRYGQPVLYVSEEAHYSIRSLGRLLQIETVIIKARSDGEIDYQDFQKKLIVDRPALMNLAIGTTFKGAIDDVGKISKIIKRKKVPAVYYHADAALFGGYLPFLRDPDAPKINFKTMPYDSIAVSGHKFFGSPIPIGIFLCKREHVQALESEYIEYINAHNITIPCSRSSLNTLIMWWTVNATSRVEFEEETQFILDNARYLYEQLKAVDYPVWLNPYSNTVYFQGTSAAVRKRWSLAETTCRYHGPLAHVVVMQHVSKEIIDLFVEDVVSSRISV